MVHSTNQTLEIFARLDITYIHEVWLVLEIICGAGFRDFFGRIWPVQITVGAVINDKDTRRLDLKRINNILARALAYGDDIISLTDVARHIFSQRLLVIRLHKLRMNRKTNIVNVCKRLAAPGERPVKEVTKEIYARTEQQIHRRQQPAATQSVHNSELHWNCLARACF